MKRPATHARLARFGLEADSWVIRSTKTGALVAFLSPADAEAVVDRLELGLSLDHALRAVRAVTFTKTRAA